MGFITQSRVLHADWLMLDNNEKATSPKVEVDIKHSMSHRYNIIYASPPDCLRKKLESCSLWNYQNGDCYYYGVESSKTIGAIGLSVTERVWSLLCHLPTGCAWPVKGWCRQLHAKGIKLNGDRLGQSQLMCVVGCDQGQTLCSFIHTMNRVWFDSLMA